MVSYQRTVYYMKLCYFKKVGDVLSFKTEYVNLVMQKMPDSYEHQNIVNYAK